MIGALARKLFGSSNERRIRSYQPRVAEINALEAELEKLSDEALRARTEDFKKQVADGASLDDILVPAFATCREAAKRTLGQRHFDVQLIGGMILHEGRISEMKTGEGKTLVATLPVYLNALAGRGVHVVTVNDYLAKRDAEWMGQIYNFLGLSVGVIVHGLIDEERKTAYDCDITYGTNNELGFDYLRDNMKYRMEDMVQRGHIYAIVDEVDSILIDEARTPLIISGPLDDRSEFYNTIDTYIPKLAKTDFEVDEKQRTVTMTEAGMEKMEQMLRADGLLKGDHLYDIENVSTVHHVNQALRAHKLFHRDKDYIVRNGEVVIIDEFTGRMMPGRRYSEGLHQALEAKEHQRIQPENQTLASITFQNYFRMYEKLAGMTGTAMTEADEFVDIYNLEVLEVPTNMPMVRVDDDDEVYRTSAEKFRSILALIDDCKARGQPVLVGTTSIEKSEQLAEMLRKAGWEQHDFSDPNAFAALYSGGENAAKAKVFAILNARYHEQEAKIIAQAGVPGAVTIATNMAGRGTDIQLGGNVRFRIRDWLLDEVKSGRAFDLKSDVLKRWVDAKVQESIDSEFKQWLEREGGQQGPQEIARMRSEIAAKITAELPRLLAVWIDENFYLLESDTWIDSRVKPWRASELEPQVQQWIDDETGNGRQPEKDAIAKKRVALLAKKGAEVAREYAEAQKRIEPFGDGAGFIALVCDRLSGPAVDLDDAGLIGVATNTIADRLRFLGHKRVLAWVRDELRAGRLPTAAELKECLASIERKTREIHIKSADIQAEVARLKEKALNAGGLYVLGTERHESRRIDNQLRGRSGRQGDPGHSKFFLSLEDDLMRIFGGTERLDGMLQRFGLKENEAIVHPWVNKALEKAQQKVEARNFDIRKNLLKFDNVMNDQRKVIFDQRIEWMNEQASAEIVADMRHAAIEDLVAKHVPENAYPEQWDTAGLKEELQRVLGLDLPVDEWAKEEGIADEELLARIERRADEHMAAKVAQWGADLMRQIERQILLQILDHLWREHLVMLEHLRQVIGLRGYGQRDPLNEYKAESYNLFEAMSQNLREAVTAQLMRLEIRTEPPPQEQQLPYMEAHKVDPSTGEDLMALADAPLAPALVGNGNNGTARAAARNPRDPSSWGKVGRNEACPCGSGKKYKHCHGRFA